MHAEYTVRAAQAGKHVLSEKPMANTPAECRQMIEASRQAQRKLMVAYRVRYEPYNQALIKVARDKEFGPLKVVLSDHGFNIGDPAQWRLKRAMAGGGSLMDIGIYSLNAARYVTGEEPTEVSAMEYTTPNDPRFAEVEETINFQLRFPSGVLANCSSSYGAPFNRIRVVGTNGWAELEPATSYGGLRMRAGTYTKVEERHPPRGRPLREGDGPPLAVRDRQHRAADAGRRGPEGPHGDDGDLRGGQEREDRQALIGQGNCRGGGHREGGQTRRR